MCGGGSGRRLRGPGDKLIIHFTATKRWAALKQSDHSLIPGFIKKKTKSLLPSPVECRDWALGHFVRLNNATVGFNNNNKEETAREKGEATSEASLLDNLNPETAAITSPHKCHSSLLFHRDCLFMSVSRITVISPFQKYHLAFLFSGKNIQLFFLVPNF